MFRSLVTHQPSPISYRGQKALTWVWYCWSKIIKCCHVLTICLLDPGFEEYTDCSSESWFSRRKGRKAATDQFLLLHMKAGSKLSDKCLGARSQEVVKREKIRSRCNIRIVYLVSGWNRNLRRNMTLISVPMFKPFNFLYIFSTFWWIRGGGDNPIRVHYILFKKPTEQCGFLKHPLSSWTIWLSFI